MLRLVAARAGSRALHCSRAVRAVGDTFVIPVPEMGDSITEGTIVAWEKQVGDSFAADEVVLVLETDKVREHAHSLWRCRRRATLGGRRGKGGVWCGCVTAAASRELLDAAPSRTRGDNERTRCSPFSIAHAKRNCISPLPPLHTHTHTPSHAHTGLRRRPRGTLWRCERAACR